MRPRCATPSSNDADRESALDEIDEGTVDSCRTTTARRRSRGCTGAAAVDDQRCIGIAVGMANEIPSHHCATWRAALLLRKNPKAKLERLRECRAVLGATDNLAEQRHSRVYATARSVKVRARFEFEELARGQWHWLRPRCRQVNLPACVGRNRGAANPKYAPAKKRCDRAATMKQLVLSVLNGRDERARRCGALLSAAPRQRSIVTSSANVLAHTA